MRAPGRARRRPAGLEQAEEPILFLPGGIPVPGSYRVEDPDTQLGSAELGTELLPPQAAIQMAILVTSR